MPDDWPPEVQARLEAARARRDEVRARYPDLFEGLRRALFRHDPVGINFGTNADEYDPEVGTILPRLAACAGPEDVLDVVHEEFVTWFGADVAGPKARFASVSAEIWEMWTASGARGEANRTRENE